MPLRLFFFPTIAAVPSDFPTFLPIVLSSENQARWIQNVEKADIFLTPCAVLILGTATEVMGREEKLAALRAIVEHVVPHRWNEVRWPNEHDLKATLVPSLPVEEVSAKIRTGPLLDYEEDLDLPCWAGEIPLRLTPVVAIPDPRLAPTVRPPADVRAYGRSPALRVVSLRLALSEARRRSQVKRAGGLWEPQRRVWALRYDRVLA